MKTILLGLFNTRSFEEHQLDCDAYPFIDTLRDMDTSRCTRAVDLAYKACDVSENILVILDCMDLPLYEDSVTTEEIRMLFRHGFQKKTKFIRYETEVDVDTLDFFGER